MRNRWFHAPVLHTSLLHEKRVSWLELFFDLIFVAAIIQLGDALSYEVKKTHAVLWPFAKFAGLYVPLWVAWTGFSFYANRFTIDDFLHRLLSFALMFTVGAMAIWAPSVAMGNDPAPFAITNGVACFILALMYGRTYWQVAVQPEGEHTRTYCRFWGQIFFVSGVLWVLSSFLPAPYHLGLWAAAVVVLLFGPVAKASRELNERFPFDMEHLSERFGLLTIIVLGESFVKVLSQLSSSSGVEWESIFKGSLNLLLTCCVWWIYFDDVAGSRLKKTRGAWYVWLYGHLPLAIAITAVGVSLKKAIFIDFQMPAPPEARWLLAGSLSAALLAVAVIDSVTERRQADLSDKSRANVRVFSAMMVLLLGQVGSRMSAGTFMIIIAAVCIGQVVFDMMAAPEADEEDEAQKSVPIAELAAKIKEEGKKAVAPRLEGILRKGAPAELRNDLYFFFMDGSWLRLFASFLAIYLVSNAFFAGLFLLDPHSISGREVISFSEAFAFSVQTMSTIGYGGMSPANPYGDLVVTFEAAAGLLGVAMATGLLFAKVSRPKSSVLFSNAIVVSKRHGFDTLMFRVGNARGNEVIDAAISVTALFDDLSPEGHHMRKLVDLKLVRDRSPIFTLSWTVMHEIDDESPLKNVDLKGSDGSLVSIIVSMTGHDGTYGQTTYARKVYGVEDVHQGKRFVDVIHQLEDGRFLMDYTVFHELIDDEDVTSEAEQAEKENEDKSENEGESENEADEDSIDVVKD
ncbi:MAG: hypothetical protein GY822_12960 [Deltaproteobacteria bacterium]|nr:hypothetical protein [Deltaproteobacteria bacterium]